MANTTYSFYARYDDIPANIPGVSLISVDLTTELNESEYLFVLNYEISTRINSEYIYGFTFSDDNNTVNHEFNFRSIINLDIPTLVEKKYTLKFRDEDSLPVFTDHSFLLSYGDVLDIDLSSSSRYEFTLPSNIFILQTSFYKFDIKYDDRNPDTFFSEHVFSFMNKNTAGKKSSRTYDFRYKHLESLPFEERIYFPFTTRKSVDLANTDPDMSVSILGRGTYTYTASIGDIVLEYKEYIVIIDNGQAYSSYFAEINIELGGSTSLYNENNISILRTEIVGNLAGLTFILDKADIDSSVSISMYKKTESEYINISRDWTGWKTFINTDQFGEFGALEDYSSNTYALVELPSRDFKILPKQPDNCCLTRAEDICSLTPPKEASYISPPKPIECEIILSVDAGKDQFAICNAETTLVGTVGGTDSETMPVEWEMIDGGVITWLSPIDQKVVTYASKFSEDKIFRFYINKGTDIEVYDDVIVYGAPQSVPHAYPSQITRESSSGIGFTLKWLLGFNGETVEYLTSRTDGDAMLLWSNPSSQPYSVTEYTLERRSRSDVEWEYVITIPYSEDNVYNNPERGYVYRVIAITNSVDNTFTSNNVYTPVTLSEFAPWKIEIWVSDLHSGGRGSITRDPTQSSYTVKNYTRFNKDAETEFMFGGINSITKTSTQSSYSVLDYIKTVLSTDDKYEFGGPYGISRESTQSRYEVFDADTVGGIGG